MCTSKLCCKPDSHINWEFVLCTDDLKTLTMCTFYFFLHCDISLSVVFFKCLYIVNAADCVSLPQRLSLIKASKSAISKTKTQLKQKSHFNGTRKTPNQNSNANASEWYATCPVPISISNGKLWSTIETAIYSKDYTHLYIFGGWNEE